MRRTAPRSAFVVLAGVTFVLALLVPVGVAAWGWLFEAASEAEVAYVSQGKLYAVDVNGGERRQVLSGVGKDSFAWSPDGRLIAYTAGSWADWEFAKAVTGWVPPSWVIRIAGADGEVLRTLPRGALTSAFAPTWSPDGKRLAFTGYDEHDDSLSTYVINADGTGLRRVTHAKHAKWDKSDPLTDTWDESPDWSPDGRWIVFERYSEEAWWSDLVAIRPDGTGARGIARVWNGSGTYCLCPRWSPGGRKIVYEAPSKSQHWEQRIFVMNADGTGERQLTSSERRVDDENPAWSPDGEWVTFDSTRDGKSEIYVIGFDGSQLKRITDDPVPALYPQWRPATGVATEVAPSAGR